MEVDDFQLEGKVEAVLIGTTSGSVISTSVPKIQVIQGHGVKGDCHAGARFADVREKTLLEMGFSKGHPIANYREVSIVSAEELRDIERGMGLGVERIPYGYLGENLVISGIPRLTELPTGSMLFFQKESVMRTAVLVIWSENTPCSAPGNAIQEYFPGVKGNLAALFVKQAIGRRGIVGSVYASGNIAQGDTVIVKVPKQRTYSP